MEEEREEDFFEKELDRLRKGQQVDKWSTRPISHDDVNDLKNMGRLRGKIDLWDIIPSYPAAVQPCSLALAALPVTEVCV